MPTDTEDYIMLDKLNEANEATYFNNTNRRKRRYKNKEMKGNEEK